MQMHLPPPKISCLRPIRRSSTLFRLRRCLRWRSRTSALVRRRRRKSAQMTKNKLKSTLDLSFADVNLSQAKLLQLDAQNNADSTMAALDAVLGLDRQVTYDLIEDNSPLTAPPTDPDQLLQLALQQRPDLQALNYSQQAAVKFSHAERDQLLPTISAAGTAGSVPIRPAQYYLNNWWGGIGVNMNIPIFNGFLYSAQAKEASIRAQAASEQSRDLRDRIVTGCSHRVACGQHRVSTGRRNRRASQAGKPGALARTNTVSTWDSARSWS